LGVVNVSGVAVWLLERAKGLVGSLLVVALFLFLLLASEMSALLLWWSTLFSQFCTKASTPIKTINNRGGGCVR
jgi:hypothetical protein